jgi:hypothetical protein
MQDAIFLSASVPDKRSKNYVFEADTIAIASAVRSLVYVALGRRPIIWGGHPAITPIVWSMAESMGIDYGAWVKLYQSQYFQDSYPEDNVRFRNVVFTENINANLEDSLLNMRKRMFYENDYSCAIFIGGMSGIQAEFNLFRKIKPQVPCFPILSTGGATLLLKDQYLLSGMDVDVDVDLDLDLDLENDIDYVPLFHRLCGIELTDKRYPKPNVSD